MLMRGKLIQDGGQLVDLGENISGSKTDIKILQQTSVYCFRVSFK